MGRKTSVRFVVGLIALLAVSTDARAQFPFYQGDLSMGFGTGIGERHTNRLEVETVHGVQVNPYFYVGAGLALSWYYMDVYNVDGDWGMKAIRGLVNFKAYVPGEKAAPYLSLDVGYGGTIDQNQNYDGFYFSPSVGIRFDVRGFQDLFFSVGYQTQRLKLQSRPRLEMDLQAVVVKFGVLF